MMNNISADAELHDRDYSYITSPPHCRFCLIGLGDFVHVLLNIDKNANVCLSGYLYNLNMTDHLKQNIS